MKDGLIVREVAQFDREFLDMLLDKGYTLDSLLSLNAEESAKKFVDLSMQLDYLIPKSESNGLDYFKNISSLLFLLGKKEGFYEKIGKEIKDLDYEIIPSRAKLLLRSQGSQ